MKEEIQPKKTFFTRIKKITKYGAIGAGVLISIPPLAAFYVYMLPVVVMGLANAKN